MLQGDQKDFPPVERTTRPCAGCGEDDGMGWVVWDKPMCNRCKNAWADEAPTDDAWDQKYPEDKARYAAKKKWTANWALERLKKAKAA